MNTTSETIIRTTQRISELWRAGQWDELHNLFSADIVQAGPRLKELSRGRDAAIEGYRKFQTGAQLTDYNEENFRAEVWPGFALCSYEWRMKYTTDSERRFSSGTDQFLFREVSAEKWAAVWRYLDFWEDKKEK
jgi:hypothetical protein